MRKRPDSRHRLVGLSFAPTSRPLQREPGVPSQDNWARPQSGATTGGWVPADEPAATRRRSSSRDVASDHLELDGAEVDGAELDGAELDGAEVDSAGDSADDGPDPVRPSRPTRPMRPTLPPEAPGHRARRERHSPHQPWGRLAQRWVPEPLRDSRIDPGRRGALLLTLVAAMAAVAAAVGVWRDKPEPRPVESVSLAQVTDAVAAGGTGLGVAGLSVTGLRAAGATSRATGSPAAAAGRGSARAASTTSAQALGVIVVSVTGAVARPGLVRLAAGSRVDDAIEKAGGPTSQADLTGLNLAARLADGSSVVVAGSAGSGAGSGSSVSGPADGSAAGSSVDSGTSPTAGGGKLDLNTADAAALDALPGVGPVTAASIVAWREKNGKFTSVEQLQEISGIGPAKFAALAQLVTVGTR